MTNPASDLERLQFLARIVSKECTYLSATDARLFPSPFTREKALQLALDADLAERVDAFIGRFGRLQDTLGDKLLPNLLLALGERSGAAIDNLDHAEKLGFISSADQWFAMRQLRNQMIHEYIENLDILANALNEGHIFVALLISTADAMIAELDRRG